MIMDARTLFAEEVAIGGSTGRRLVGDVIDLSNARDIGLSDIWLVIICTTDFTSGGSATVQFELVSDAQAAIAVDGSATEHLVTSDMDYSGIDAGDRILVSRLPVEASGAPYERYLGIIANVSTAALTAGKISAFLTMDPPVRKLYPNNVQ